MQELRQSTEIKVRVGSAVDATDGVTPETTLTLGAADQAELLKHNGAATVDISGRAFAAVTSVSGWYDLTLTTTDTNTLGQLTVVIQDSSLMAPIFRDFMVIAQQYWDSKYSTDTLQVDVTQWLGTTAATPTVAGVPEVDLTHIAGSVVATGTAQLGVNVVTEENIDFGALKKTSLNASTPASVTTVTGNVNGDVSGNVAGSVGSLTGHTNQTGDSYPIVSHADYGNAKLVRSTTPANSLDVAATGEAGLDFDNIKDATGAHTLTNITVPVTTAVTNEVSADAVKISGDGTAADNLEATYDGTGYTNDSAPSTQQQVGRLTSGTAAINTVAESFTKAGAEPETNTYASTFALDGVFHIVEDDATATDAYYQFDVGGNGVPVSITWQGYAQSQGDSYTTWAYNYGTTAYEQIGTITAVAGTTVVENTYALTNAHVGTGANIGKVRFRFLSADGTAFATDRILCSYSVVTKSAGYSDGAIWINTNNSNTNTEDYVDGTSDNPVSTWAAAKTLSASLGIKKFSIINGSSITLDANSDNFTFVGFDYDLALGGQSLENTHIEEANASGICTSGAGTVHFHRCQIDAITAGKSRFSQCGFTGTNIASTASTYMFDTCYNAADGSVAPIFDFGAANGDTHAAFRDWQGGIEIKNLGQLGSDVFTVTGAGSVVIGVTCIAGTIKIVGAFTITDNTAAGFSGTLSDDARYDVGQINDECDTALSDIKLDHLIAVADADEPVDDSIIAKMTSKAATADWSTFTNTDESLEAIRDRGDAAWSAAAGNPSILNTTTIDTLASQTSFTLIAGSSDDDAYKDCIIIVVDSVTATQKCIGKILSYAGASKTVTLEADPAIFTMAGGDSTDILAVEKVWTAATKEVDTVTGNVDGNVGGNVTGSVGSLGSAAVDSIIDEVIDDTTHTVPNSLGAMNHATYCRNMQKREADSTSETSYKLDDTTPLKTFTLSSVAGTVTRT